MLIAQATLEYVGAAGLSALLATAEQAGHRLQANFQEHPVIWIGAGVLVLWLFGGNLRAQPRSAGHLDV